MHDRYNNIQNNVHSIKSRDMCLIFIFIKHSLVTNETCEVVANSHRPTWLNSTVRLSHVWSCELTIRQTTSVTFIIMPLTFLSHISVDARGWVVTSSMHVGFLPSQKASFSPHGKLAGRAIYLLFNACNIACSNQFMIRLEDLLGSWKKRRGQGHHYITSSASIEVSVKQRSGVCSSVCLSVSLSHLSFLSEEASVCFSPSGQGPTYFFSKFWIGYKALSRFLQCFK